jgi:hypothetical protein
MADEPKTPPATPEPPEPTITDAEIEALLNDVPPPAPPPDEAPAIKEGEEAPPPSEEDAQVAAYTELYEKMIGLVGKEKADAWVAQEFPEEQPPGPEAVAAPEAKVVDVAPKAVPTPAAEPASGGLTPVAENAELAATEKLQFVLEGEQINGQIESIQQQITDFDGRLAEAKRNLDALGKLREDEDPRFNLENYHAWIKHQGALEAAHQAKTQEVASYRQGKAIYGLALKIVEGDSVISKYPGLYRELLELDPSRGGVQVGMPLETQRQRVISRAIAKGRLKRAAPVAQSTKAQVAPDVRAKIAKRFKSSLSGGRGSGGTASEGKPSAKGKAWDKDDPVMNEIWNDIAEGGRP